MLIDKKTSVGFTLAELLIALALLSLIAVFTIPKVLEAERHGKYNAMAREAVSTVAQAYGLMRLEKKQSASTSPVALLDYLNYVRTVTTEIDDIVGYGSLDCLAPHQCVLMHNGGVLWMDATNNFGGTSHDHAIYLNFDADGKNGGSTSGDSKSVQIIQYYSGRVTTGAYMTAGTLLNGAPQTPSPDPSWFSW